MKGREFSDELPDKGFLIGIKHDLTVRTAEEMNM